MQPTGARRVSALRPLALLAHVMQNKLAARCLDLPHLVRLRVERLAPPVRHALHHAPLQRVGACAAESALLSTESRARVHVHREATDPRTRGNQACLGSQAAS